MSGNITSDQTWSGTVNVTADTTIAAGVTVTVEPGTEINVANEQTSITVGGTLDVQGTAAGKVHIQAANSAPHFGGIVVAKGGTYQLAFGVQYGGGIHVNGTATVTDTKMWNADGDYLTAEGSTTAVIDVSYSQMGDLGPADTQASTDSTHCDTHFSAAGTITINHSNIATASYGLMLYTGSMLNADLQNNNWYGNAYDIEPNTTAMGNANGGYFSKGAPTGLPGVTAQNLATAPLADAGPRG